MNGEGGGRGVEDRRSVQDSVANGWWVIYRLLLSPTFVKAYPCGANVIMKSTYMYMYTTLRL